MEKSIMDILHESIYECAMSQVDTICAFICSSDGTVVDMYCRREPENAETLIPMISSLMALGKSTMRTQSDSTLKDHMVRTHSHILAMFSINDGSEIFLGVLAGENANAGSLLIVGGNAAEKIGEQIALLEAN